MCTITTELSADPPDNVCVLLDSTGTWVPPEGKEWRIKSDQRSPDGKERVVLWVRDPVSTETEGEE